MGRVLTNNTSFSYAIEATETAGSRGIGFLPGEDPGDGGGALPGVPAWKQIEPNDISTFGSSVSTVARNPIRRSRGRRKGTLSDLDSAVEFEADLTVDAFYDFMEGFMFAKFSNADLIFRGADAATAGDTYTVAALTAAQAAKLQSSATIDTLLYARGYANPANNGLKTLATAASANDTTISVSENLVDEVASVNTILEIAGAILRAGEMDLTVTGTGTAGDPRVGQLTFATVDPTTLGLSVGSQIYVLMEGTNRGFARVTDINASTGIRLTRMDASLVAATPTGDSEIRFGQFLKDVASDDGNFLQRSIQFEADFPGLAANGTSSEYEYAKGNFFSTLGVNMSLSDKAVMDFGFTGTDTDPPTATRKTNAGGARKAIGTEAFSTSADFARLRIIDVDEQGLTTDFVNMSVTIDNNVGPEKVLNKLGAKFVNFGNFFIDVEAELIFQSSAVLARIRNNTTVGMDFVLKNGDGIVAFDIPSMTLGDGARDYPINESVKINLSGQAFEDDTSGASIGVSFIPAIP